MIEGLASNLPIMKMKSTPTRTCSSSEGCTIFYVIQISSRYRKEMSLISIKMDSNLEGCNEGTYCVMHHSLVRCCEVLATHLINSHDGRSLARVILHVLNCYVVSCPKIAGLYGADCGDAGARCSSSGFRNWTSVSTGSYTI